MASTRPICREWRSSCPASPRAPPQRPETGPRTVAGRVTACQRGTVRVPSRNSPATPGFAVAARPLSQEDAPCHGRPAALLAALARARRPAAAAQTQRRRRHRRPEREPIFDNANFQALRVKKVRYFIKWDAIDRPRRARARPTPTSTRASATAQRAHARLVEQPDAARRPELPVGRDVPRRKVKQLIDRYRPQGVRTWGAMNEANHDSQPTWNNPRRAAQFFLALRSICRGCTIVALDVLDQRGVDRYIQPLLRALGSRKRLASDRRHPQLLGHQPLPRQRHAADPRTVKRTTGARSSG